MTRWDDDANPELEWFDKATLEDLARLRSTVIDDFDRRAEEAHGIVGWIIGGDVNAVSKPTRARYRAILREVGPPGPPSRRRRAAQRQRGAASLQMLAGGAVAGSGLVLAHQGRLLAPVAAAGLLVITRSPETEGPGQAASWGRASTARGTGLAIVGAQANDVASVSPPPRLAQAA